MCVLWGRGFPGGSNGKESACNAGDLGSIPGSGRSPEGRNGSPLQYCCLENPHGQRSLVGYSPWGHKESDRMEWLMTKHSTCVCDQSLLEECFGIRIEKMDYSKEITELSSGCPVTAPKFIFTHFNHMYTMVIYYTHTHTKPVYGKSNPQKSFSVVTTPC